MKKQLCDRLWIKEDVTFWALLLIIIAACIYIGYQLGQPNFITVLMSKNTPVNDSVNLANWTKNTINDTSKFYKYNLSNINKTLTDDELKAEGGVCKHWSEYYARLGKEAGFNSKTVLIELSNGTYHEIAILSNTHEYCILDEMTWGCSVELI